MCCKIADVEVFEEGEEEKVFYKVTRSNRRPPFYDFMYNCPTYLTGSTIVSRRRDKTLEHYEVRYCEIEEGIHVLLTQKDAEVFKQQLCEVRDHDPSNYLILKVSAKKDDLVGVGYWSDERRTKTAVFMKVTVLD